MTNVILDVLFTHVTIIKYTYLLTIFKFVLNLEFRVYTCVHVFFIWWKEGTQDTG